MSDVVIVLTTVGNAQAGEAIARAVVEERLAACCTISGPMTSIYRWQGEVTTDSEQQLVIKTTADRLEALRVRVHQLHPYEVPEFLVLPVSEGSPAYLDWVRQQTRP